MSLMKSQDVDVWYRAHRLRGTEKQRMVAGIVLNSRDYPDLDELRRRIAAVSPCISLATVYRTLRLLVGLGLRSAIRFKVRWPVTDRPWINAKVI